MILCDQVSRNAFRGTPDAFAFDDAAIVEARKIYADETYKQYQAGHFMFLFTPSQHSELKTDHDMGLALLEYAEDKFGKDKFAQMRHHVIEHKAVVDRFGRYPHRNKQLGRDSTPEEEAWLADVDNLPAWAKRS